MMSEQCKKCGGEISANDYFCPHCGAKLKTPPYPTTAWSQIKAYLVSVFFPPFGLWYVYRYFRNGDGKSKKIAVVAAILTVASIAFTVWVTQIALDSLNREIERQIEAVTF